MPLIESAIPAQNFEVVLLRISAILTAELASQFALSADQALDVTVYTERDKPFNHAEVPAVNIMLARGEYGSKDVEQADGIYVFAIDVYQKSSNSSSARAGELASIKLQRAIGVIRGILMNPRYKTLGIAPPSLERAQVTNVQIKDPERDHDATSVRMGRILFEVKVPETVSLSEGIEIGGFDTTFEIGDSGEGYRWGADRLAEPFNLVVTNGTTQIDISFEDSNYSPSGFYLLMATEFSGEFTIVQENYPDDFSFRFPVSYEDYGEVLFFKVRAFDEYYTADSEVVSGYALGDNAPDPGSVRVADGGDIFANDVPSGGVKEIEFTDQAGDDINSIISSAVNGVVIVQTANFKSEMLLAADAYFTRIGAANEAFENAVIDWAKALGDYRVYPSIKDTLIYPAWPETEAQGVYPFFNVSGSAFTENRMQNFNSATYSAGLGFEANGVDNGWWIPIHPDFWPGAANLISANWYQYITRLDTTGGLANGYFVNNNLLCCDINAVISLGRFDFGGYVQKLGGRMVSSSSEEADFSPENDLYTARYYDDADYDNSVSTDDDVNPSSPFVSSNRLFFLGARDENNQTNQLSPVAPSQYCDNAIGMISFHKGMSKTAAKIYAEASDALQVNFGR